MVDISVVDVIIGVQSKIGHKSAMTISIEQLSIMHGIKQPVSNGPLNVLLHKTLGIMLTTQLKSKQGSFAILMNDCESRQNKNDN